MQQSGLDQLALAYQKKKQPSTSEEARGKGKKQVLVIWSEHDKDNGLGTERAAMIPGAQFREVPGDHNHAASTKEFANEALAFFKK